MHSIAGSHAHPVRLLSGGVLLWLMALLAPLAAIAAPATVSVCVDDGFAPFEYALHENPRVPRGATATLIQQILTRNKIAYRVAWYPWSRCLAYIKQGDIHLGMDTYFDAARAREVLYSEPYYTLTPQYYFSRRKYPSGLGIQDRDDLKKFRGCGVRGYSYAHYGLSERDLESGALDDIQLVEKLARGHCDYFVEELEVMQGYALTGHPFLDNPDLGHGAVPGAVPPQMHFILARNSAVSVWLLPLLNREIALSNKQGTMRRLMDAILHRSAHVRGE